MTKAFQNTFGGDPEYQVARQAEFDKIERDGAEMINSFGVGSKALRDGFVLHSNGEIYVQKADDSRFGFSLHDDDQSYEGGLGLGNGTWELLEDSDPRITVEVRERLGWILDD